MTADPDLNYRVDDKGSAFVENQASPPKQILNRDLASIQTTPGEKQNLFPDKMELFSDEAQEEKKEAEPVKNQLLDTITI